ncbi:MAG: YncE family protein [Candidatus Limnocylindrales bacterium]
MTRHTPRAAAALTVLVMLGLSFAAPVRVAAWLPEVGSLTAAATPIGTWSAPPAPPPGAARLMPWFATSPRPVEPAAPAAAFSDTLRLRKVTTITGNLSPKSVVSSQQGLFFAQNMIYRHSVSVFDRDYQLVKTIHDRVRLSDFGYPKYDEFVKGGPVEAGFTPDRAYVYVSNYSMYGPGFAYPGGDGCTRQTRVDRSFVYRINVATLTIDQAIRVGRVPKYVAVSPDGKYVVVTNWCSYDVSIIDVAQAKEVERILVGPHPRGIAIDAASNKAYVGILYGDDIAVIDLDTFHLGWFRNIGSSPRHLILDPAGEFLYVSRSGADRISKIDLATGTVVDSVAVGDDPRSMDISDDGRSLYVGIYEANLVTKIRTSDMDVLQSLRTGNHPIGLTYDIATRQVWVSCYSGSIRVFHDE